MLNLNSFLQKFVAAVKKIPGIFYELFTVVSLFLVSIILMALASGNISGVKMNVVAANLKSDLLNNEQTIEETKNKPEVLELSNWQTTTNEELLITIENIANETLITNNLVSVGVGFRTGIKEESLKGTAPIKSVEEIIDKTIQVGIAVISDGQTSQKEEIIKESKEEVIQTTENKTNSEQKKETKKTETKKENVQKDSGTKRKLSDEDYQVLLRIVEAEATGEDIKGKILVANVILNRVDHKQFPNTVKKVVFQKNGSTVQFSPIKDGRFWSVKVTKETKKAVKRALNGEDYSKGALFFSARSKADKRSMNWFDKNLKWLFKYGGHEFYTLKK